MTEDSTENTQHGDTTMTCKVCTEPIRPGDSRLPHPTGAVHEDCINKVPDGYRFKCEGCGYSSEAVGYIRACPRCGSAKTTVERHTRRRSPPTTNKERILSVVEKHGPVTSSALNKHFQFDVLPYISMMYESGALEREGKGGKGSPYRYYVE